MIITLKDGSEIEVKNIDIKKGLVDYKRIDDPVYSGDCAINIVIPVSIEVKTAIKTAVEGQLNKTVAIIEATK